MKLIMTAIATSLLVGCSNNPKQEIVANTAICFFSSCTIQAKADEAGSSLETNDKEDFKSTEDTSSSLPGL